MRDPRKRWSARRLLASGWMEGVATGVEVKVGADVKGDSKGNLT
jgi:hypothetical protein